MPASPVGDEAASGHDALTALALRQAEDPFDEALADAASAKAAGTSVCETIRSSSSLR